MVLLDAPPVVGVTAGVLDARALPALERVKGAAADGATDTKAWRNDETNAVVTTGQVPAPRASMTVANFGNRGHDSQRILRGAPLLD